MSLHASEQQTRVLDTEGPSLPPPALCGRSTGSLDPNIPRISHTCSQPMLGERPVCFPGMTAIWRVLLLWACVCICRPAEVGGALVISRSDAPTQVFKICAATACGQMSVLFSMSDDTSSVRWWIYIYTLFMKAWICSCKCTSLPCRICRRSGSDVLGMDGSNFLFSKKERKN